ncbi:MAG: DUF502 domain-containing protein [Methylococcales bacterium]
MESGSFLRLFNSFEELIIQIPVFKSIYTAIRYFVSFFQRAERKFKQVVLVQCIFRQWPTNRFYRFRF